MTKNQSTENQKIEKINARVLLATQINEQILSANDVISVDKTTAEHYELSGIIDTNAEAVEYALSINSTIIEI